MLREDPLPSMDVGVSSHAPTHPPTHALTQMSMWLPHLREFREQTAPLLPPLWPEAKMS